MPTAQGIDAFDHGFDVPADYDALFTDGTDPSAVTDPLYQGRLNSLRISPTGSNEGIRKNIAGGVSRGWTAFPYRVTASPSTEQGILRLHSNTSNINGSLSISTGRVLIAFISGGVPQTGPTLSIDTWYWIEAIYNVINTTHSLFWRVAGADQTTATVAATAADTVTYAQLFSTSGGAPWYTGGYWAWGQAFSDSDWLGEPSAPAAGGGARNLLTMGTG